MTEYLNELTIEDIVSFSEDGFSFDIEDGIVTSINLEVKEV